MGEEAEDFDFDLVADGGGSEEDRVMEWESGLPGAEEMTPLSQPLVPPGLAAAFRIPPEPGRTLLDVHRASAATVSRLRCTSSSSSGSFQPFPASAAPSSKAVAATDDADSSAAPAEASGGGGGGGGSAVKRPRLVWTPQLHKRFVDVVAHLGIRNAVPKTIMQLMNVEGLTRENVASHLQKYRLYVKRMQGLSNEGPSPSDHIFAPTPVPKSLHEPQAQVPVPMPYAAPTAAMYHPMPMAMAVGMVPMNGHHHHNGHAVYSGYGHGVSYPHYHHGDK